MANVEKPRLGQGVPPLLSRSPWLCAEVATWGDTSGLQEGPTSPSLDRFIFLLALFLCLVQFLGFGSSSVLPFEHQS